MKLRTCCLAGLLALMIVGICPLVAQDVTLGTVRIPRAFVHGDVTHTAGVYRLVLTEKDGHPWFKVQDAQGNPLFEEMAVVKENKSPKMRRAFRMKREILRGYEFYRIRVIQPERWVMAYLQLVK